MTFHSYHKTRMADSTMCAVPLASPNDGNLLQARQAETLGDFMEVTRLMKRACRQYAAPVDSNHVGRSLSRLRHGGSGPDTGCVVLAEYANEPVGFALVLNRQGTNPGIVWLHAEDSAYSDEVTKALIAGFDRIRSEWDPRHIPSVRMPA